MLRILLIDDNPYDRILAIRELERGFNDLQITEVIQAEDFDRVLEAGKFDLVITDYQIRWTDGLTVLRTIKSRYPELPVVMFTNSGSQEIAVEAMKSGLDDYVIKSPTRYTRLPSAARLALERAATRRKATGLENRLQTLLNRLDVGIYRLSAEGVFIEANRAFLRLLGLDAATEIGPKQTLEPYFQPDDYTQLLDQLMQEGEVRDREIELRRADGSWLWVRISKTLTQVDNTTLIDGLIEDISDRKHIELENARLYQQAQEANQLKDEFLAIASHELRTPLNALLGWAQILRRQKLDAATTTKALEVIERNAKRQGKLIEDILDVSRIIRNQLHLNRQPLDLLPIIQAAIEDLQLSAQEKSIQIQTVLLPVGQVVGDAERLQQVVWNLLSNAIKFTPKGGRVDIRLEPFEDVELGRQRANAPQTSNFKPQTQFALITIQDTGQGIAADFLPHVFDRFRQADGSKTRSQGGLGLGLAIVHHLIEMHHGKVTVTSDGVGKGSTFTVQLPLLKSGEKSPADQAEPKAALLPQPAYSPIAGSRILVVDDDADTCELLTFLLEQQGVQVATASSVSEGLNLLPDFKPDLLLSDIGMPDEDGYSLIRKVRESKLRIPAVALTAFARDEDRQRALEAGFQAHITKPVNPSELLSQIRRLIER